MLKKIILIFFIFILNLFSLVQAEEALKINSINFDNSDNIIFLGSSSKVMYINVKSMKLSNPDRISFDIDNAVLTKPNSSWTFKNSDIKQVKLSQFTTDPDVVRMVITYDKGFNVNKLKLYRIDNNLVFVYNKKLFAQSNLRSVYSDEKSKQNYYEYTLISEDVKTSAPAADTSNYVRSPEAVEIQKAFNSKGELVKKDPVQITVSKPNGQKLKSNFHVNKIDVKRGNALIRGIGSIAVENPFIVANPTRLVFDMPNTYVAPEIRNKEYVLSEKETIKIGQFEPTKARIVVTSEDAEKFRPIYSYDSQSIFLAHDDRILGMKLYDRTSSTYSYAAKKINDTTDVLQFVFTEPIIHSIKKFSNKVEINLYNSSGFDHAAYRRNLNSDVLSKLRTEALPGCGIKVIIPIQKTTELDYQQSFDNKQLRLTIVTPKEETIKQSKPAPAIIARNPNVKTIVIDAGHGGSDVGATREGIYEKDITLDMSKRLAAILKKKGFNVLMVRSSDEYVSLQDRVTFTEENKGDLFVSIHVNSSVTPEGNGLETHYYTPQSYEFAQIVHKEFAAAIDSKDRGLFKSKFYVINHTTCPSILVETGFISNPEERKALMSAGRKQKTAEAVAKGILKYLGKD